MVKPPDINIVYGIQYLQGRGHLRNTSPHYKYIIAKKETEIILLKYDFCEKKRH